jgi:hypothetical protein
VVAGEPPILVVIGSHLGEARVRFGVSSKSVLRALGGKRWWPETVRGVLRSVALDQEAA